MQTTSSRLFFSIITKHLPNSPKHLIWEPSFALFSTDSNRPTTGKWRQDDRSDKFFLKDLNFGDEITPEKADKSDSNLSSPIPGRPLRGEPQEDFFPDYNSKHTKMSRNRPDKKPGSFQQKIKSDYETNAERSHFFSQKGSPGSIDRINGDKEKEGDRVGESLFQKLKLGAFSGEKLEESDNAKKETESPPEDSDQIFKKMKETGMIPNAVAMLDGLCKDGLVQDAMKLFGLMREKGTIPEVVIYTAVVEGFCKAAKFDDAKRIFRKMQKNEIVPNAFSYSVMIQGLCKGKKLEDAVEFCNEMLDAGKSPNGSTFTGLVDVCCKEKGMKEAEELVSNLRKRGYALDEKAIREHLDKKGPYSPMVWEAIFGKKSSQRPF